MNALIFKNAQLVLPHEVVSGSVRVVDGCIASVDSGPALEATGIDLEGDYLMPGFVEMHTDNFERHLMPRPKVQWAEMPALLAHDAEVAASGITTVFDALGVGDADPDSLRGSTWNAVLNVLQFCSCQNLLRAYHHLHVRCELPAPNTIDLFAPFHDHPRLSLISLMDHTPGQRQFRDMEKYYTYATRGGRPMEEIRANTERKIRDGRSLNAKNRPALVQFAREMGPYNVRCNGIAPAVIDAGIIYAPEFAGNALAQGVINAMVANTPLQRMGKPEEVGAVVDFLISPGAAYINGQIIGVDGGFSA
jgi:phosphonate metabolism protein PhnM